MLLVKNYYYDALEFVKVICKILLALLCTRCTFQT